MKIYENDCNLPGLPVAELKDTCQTLKKMIEPLVTDIVLEKTGDLLDSFCSGEGQILQEHLLRWKNGMPYNESWLRPMWDDMCLCFRDSLPIYMNFDFQLNSKRWQDNALAKLIAGLARAIDLLRQDNLAAETSGKGYLSMDTLYSMIYTRIPNSTRDDLYYPPLCAPLTAAVVCKGHWFILSLTGPNNLPVSFAAIAGRLSEIRNIAEHMDVSEKIGAFTTLDRDSAHTLRSRLQENLLNRTNFEKIEKALFVVCLDEPLTEEEVFGHRTLGGDAENRWYDKSLQIISCEDKIGTNFEHAGCDAGIWCYLLSQADRLICENKVDDGDGKAHISKLEWNISSADKKELLHAQLQFKDMLSKIAVGQKKITTLSKEAIKEKKCSPDAFVQMAFQAAYYSLTGSFRSVYESVSTRNFYQGRTECIRGCTMESKDFVTELCKQNLEKTILQEKFKKAIAAHMQTLARCQAGMGPERHMTGLLAMHKMYEDTDIPKIFADEGYLSLRHDALSTSSVTGPCIDFFGFGPVTQDGIGIGYGISAQSLNLMVTAYPESKIQPDVFINEVEKYGKLMLDLL